MKTIYAVISLPRTGTMSISKMAKIVGLNPQHTPLWSLDYQLKADEYNFFSDTPTFAPSYVKKMCELEDINVKFIYIEKSFRDILTSWKKVGLYNNYSTIINSDPEHLKPGQLFDKKIYLELFGNTVLNENTFQYLFNMHKDNVVSLVKEYGKDLLMYSFDQGWGAFCELVGVPVPNVPIPKLNTNTMFDKI